MSMYDGNESAGLYEGGGWSQESAAAPASSPAAAAPSVEVVPVSASDALVESVELIAAPSVLLSEVLPANPSDSKLPYGLAVFGACLAAIIWANSIDKKGRKS